MRRLRRRFRRGIAPAVIALIVLAAAAATFVVVANNMQIEVPYLVEGMYRPGIIDRIKMCNPSLVTTAVDIYLNNTYVNATYDAFLVDIVNNNTVDYWLALQGNTRVETQLVGPYAGHILVVVIHGEEGDYFDAINISHDNGDKTCVLGIWYDEHIDPTPWLDLLVTRETWLALLGKYLGSFWVLAYAVFSQGLNLVGVMLPYAGIMLTIAIVEAMMTSMETFSLTPIFEIFRKLYDLIFKITNAIVQVIMKIIDLITPT